MADDFKPHPRQADHPLTIQRMVHTACMSDATSLINQMVALGVVDRPETWDEYWTLRTRVEQELRERYPTKVLARARGKA